MVAKPGASAVEWEMGSQAASTSTSAACTAPTPAIMTPTTMHTAE